MTSPTINGVQLIKLKTFADDRGAVMHMLRNDSDFFSKFGEIYFSQINYRVIKAWKCHKLMTQRLTVPQGKVKIVIFDNRKKSVSRGKINSFELSPDNYNLLLIPPQLWYGFQGIATPTSLIANCTDIVHNPDEVENLEVSNSNIPFSW